MSSVGAKPTSVARSAAPAPGPRPHRPALRRAARPRRARRASPASRSSTSSRCFEAAYGETPDPLPDPPPDRARPGPAALGQPHRHRDLHGGRLHQPRLVLGPVHRARRRVARPPTGTAGPRAAARTYPAATCSCAACSTADRTDRAISEKPDAARRGLASAHMITNVSLVTVYCLDQDEARDFYVDVLGFEATHRRHHGRGLPLGDRRPPEPARARGHADDPRPAAGRPEAAAFVRRQLEKGQMGGLGLQVDDCRKTYRGALAKGVDVPAGAVRRGPTASRPSCATTPATGWCWSSRTTSPPSRSTGAQRLAC